MLSHGRAFITLLVMGQAGATVHSAETPANTVSPPVTTLETIRVTAPHAESPLVAYGANRATVISREDLKKYGDTSVQDALKRAAGQQGGKGGFRGMRGGPVFQINGETVSNGRGGGNPLIDSLSVDDIERIEIIRQPSASLPGSGTGMVVNIITRKPAATLFAGAVKVGAGRFSDSPRLSESTLTTLKLEGRDKKWGYSLSGNQMQNTMRTENAWAQAGNAPVWETGQTRTRYQLLAPRLDYTVNDSNKLFLEYFYNSHNMRTSYTDSQQQNDVRQNRTAVRWENYGEKTRNTVRLNYQTRREEIVSDSPVQNMGSSALATQNVWGAQYAGEYKTAGQFVRYGMGWGHLLQDSQESATASSLHLSQDDGFIFIEDNWNISRKHRLTAGLRQEYLKRQVSLQSALDNASYSRSDSPLAPTLYYKYIFTPQLNWQIGGNRSLKPPATDELFAIRKPATGSGAGSLSNPDEQGNPDLQSQRITSLDTSLAYSKADKNVLFTIYDRRIKNYIETAIITENGRYTEMPVNQPLARARGVELEARRTVLERPQWIVSVNSQLTTSFVQVDDREDITRRAEGVAPYILSGSVSSQYRPWRLVTGLNLGYTPAYTRPMTSQPWLQRNSALPVMDLNITSNWYKNWSISLGARNLLYPERRVDIQYPDGSPRQTRLVKTVPVLLFTVERKF